MGEKGRGEEGASWRESKVVWRGGELQLLGVVRFVEHELPVAQFKHKRPTREIEYG